MTRAIFDKPDRLTLGYLIALPSIMLLGIAAASVTLLIAPHTPDGIDVAALMMLGALAASNLLSILFAVRCYHKARPSTDRWALLAIFILIAMLAFGSAIVISVAVYAITLFGTRKTPRITVQTILLRVCIPTVTVGLLSVILLIGSSHLLFGEHFYTEPTIGEGFDHSELYSAEPVEWIEADEGKVIGVYSHVYYDAAASDIGFALYETKVADGKTLYRYINDSGLCYPAETFAGDDEGYTVNEHDENGYPVAKLHPWGEWHRVSDDYAVCLIPASSDRTPDGGIEVVRSAEVTLNGVAFELYVGMGEVE